MPVQQINLDHSALHRQRVQGSFGQGLLAAALLLGGVAALSTGLQRDAAQRRQQTQALLDQAALRPVALAGAASGAATPTAMDKELAQLRQLDAAQRRIQQALAEGAAGTTESYTGYLLALARQSQPSLWITGLSVGPDGQALTLEGRMLDAQALPAYLRRLSAEPRFKGRSFAQLQLRPATEAGTPVTEFSLRSSSQAPTVVAAR